MQYRALHLAEGPVLREQLQLLSKNISGSLLSPLITSLLLFWILPVKGRVTALIAWCSVVVILKFYTIIDARRYLATSSPDEQTLRFARKLIALHALYGVIVGVLPWLVFEPTLTISIAVVITLIASTVASNMSLLAPVLPVFLAMSIPLASLTVIKLLLMNDSAYNALALAVTVAIAGIIMQARNSSMAAFAAIQLRFENLDLIERLHIETENARIAEKAAEQANLAKSKFLAAASHDLRQPVHALGLYMEVLAHSELSTKQYEVLGGARASAQASAEMLNTLLDFSRIEAGVVEPHIHAFRLQPLLHKIENEFASLANAKGLLYRSRETFATVQSDPVLVELILRNLVSNAIRYTHRGGVLVGCRRRGNEVRLEVWDSGIGIEKTQHREIFREFHQLGNAERDRLKGLGLGLAIADGFARALGQQLSLDSTPQRGSVFRLNLPLCQSGVLEYESAAVPANLRFGLTVLVIEDDEAVRAGMLSLLRDWGCVGYACESVDEAAALARAHLPDLIISDYRLRGERTGAQAIASLRAEFGAHLAAILITGDTAPERLREAHASGIPLLHKPVLPAQLHREIADLLGAG